MGVFAGLASLACLSLFLARELRLSSSLTPLVAVAAGMLWLTVFGCAGLLYPAAVAWYVLCAAAGIWLLAARRRTPPPPSGGAGRSLALTRGARGVEGLITPGYLCFLAGSIGMIVLFLYTKPMLTQWDEFTFWGANAKITGTWHQLYTVAPTSQIARSYPPGLIVHSYLMQFFGGYSEPGQIAANAVLYMACFAAGTAVWGKNRAGAVVMMAAMCVMPLLFETGGEEGGLMQAYLVCMADMPLGALFGGALCYHFAGEANGARSLVPFGAVLAALCNVKDIGLALALIALFVAAADLLLRGRKNLRFWRLHGGAAWAAAVGCGALLVVGFYLLWAWHLAAALPLPVDRFNIGAKGQHLGQAEMLLSGMAMLFGAGRSEKFSAILGEMLAAFYRRPVGFLGTGALVLAGIAVLVMLGVGVCGQKAYRRRLVGFGGSMLLCFAAFYLFNIFVYTFIFSDIEAYILKDYGRYIAPFWMGWLMAALALLGRAAADETSSFARRRAARLGAAAVCVAFTLLAVLRFGWQASFLQQSPSVYGQRLNLQQVVQEARQQGLERQDTVYIISQEDDGTRFYILGHEMEALRSLLYTGVQTGEDGLPAQDTQGKPVYMANVAATLVHPQAELWRPYDVPCSAGQLQEYLKAAGCTHLLLDVVDDYIVEEFGPLASDGMAGWEGAQTGHRYYRIQWQADGSMRLLAQEGGEG